MKILHYALGFPPYRSGGSIKFCLDLLRQQIMDGHQAAMAWPGRMGFFSHRVSVREKKICGIQSFEICNPLPVPYDEGIRQCARFMEDAGGEAYRELFERFCPDVIHIHTLMGLHDSFLEAAREKRIRCVFTAHDYFPICPKVTMVRCGQVCASAKTYMECGKCNQTALSISRIRLLQSMFYRIFKDISFVRRLRRRHRERYLSGETVEERGQVPAESAEYEHLRRHYHTFLEKMDVIHYNSTVTRAVYEEYLHLPHSVVINISHGDIRDCREERVFSQGKRRMAYLGPSGEAKGFFMLQAALDRLWEKDKGFILDIYFKPARSSPYMRSHDRYTYPELGDVFERMDLLIVPSIWKETFGYVVLEALSYGVPVLMSGNVGARDILAEGAGVVIEDITVERLYDALRMITDRHLADMGRVIRERQKIPTMRQTARIIEEKCYRGRSGEWAGGDWIRDTEL